MAAIKASYLRGHTLQLEHFAVLASLIVTVAMAHPGHDDPSINGHAPILSNWGRLLYRAAEEFKLPGDQELTKYLDKNHGGSVYDPITGNTFEVGKVSPVMCSPHSTHSERKIDGTPREGPGPGAYATPPHFGREETSAVYGNAPSFTFGVGREYYDRIDANVSTKNSPGPGHYRPQTNFHDKNSHRVANALSVPAWT